MFSFFKKKKVIAHLKLSGVIGNAGKFKQGIDFAGQEELIKKAFSLKKATCVAITINSPGGSPVQSHLIYSFIRNQAKKNKKKVIVFAEDVAASGGYLISCAGDEIYANSSSIIGSIGVIYSSFGFQELIKKIGVQRRVYTAGKNKSTLDPFKEEKEEDIQRLKKIQLELHSDFIKVVETSRGSKLKDPEKNNIFTGEFWTGSAALKLGLVDGIGHVKPFFEKKFGKTPLYEHHTTSLVFNDPPYHTVVRKLLSAGFTPRKLAEMEPLIIKIVNGLLDRLEDLSEFDLVKEYAMALPTEIISFMLGIPVEHRHKLRQYSLNILGALDPVVSQERLDEGNFSVEEFGEVLSQIINHRRSEQTPKSDGEILMSLILGDVNGQRLTNTELIQNCIFLLNAGHETTTSMVANSMHMFFSAPDQLNLLKDDSDLITTAIEEGLRYESPLQVGNRVTTGEVEIGGELLPTGTYIHTSIAGANRDPAEFNIVLPLVFNIIFL